MPDYILGIDIGGTKILSGIVNSSGEIISRVKQRTPDYSALNMVNWIGDTAEDMCREMGIKIEELLGIAVASPGPFNMKEGQIMQSPNLKWDCVQLRDMLEKRFGREVLLNKDTNYAALGELYFGNARECSNFIYMTVSTGIGGAIIINRQLYYGDNGGAGEIGHMVIDPRGRKCSCGRRGCLEAQASGTAIAEAAREMISRENLGKRGKGLAGEKNFRAEDVARAARQGDLTAKCILLEALRYLILGIVNLVHIFNPEKVILGGSVIWGLQDIWQNTLQEEVNKHIFKLHGQNISVEVSALNEDVGLLGCTAAVLLHHNML